MSEIPKNKQNYETPDDDETLYYPAEWNIVQRPEYEKPDPVTTLIAQVTDPKPDSDGLVYAQILGGTDFEYSSEEAAKGEEDDRVVNALLGYDPSDFPEEIRAQILKGEPFEVVQTVHESYDDLPLADNTTTTYTLIKPFDQSK